jgi:F-type H+-transporting ATPase subunit b
LLLLALEGNAIQLVPDGTLLFHVALIALMVALLNVTLLKPINRILEDRERRTKGRLAESQAVLASVNAKLREHEARLREARAEGYVLLEEERAAVSRERERKVSEVKAEVSTWLQEQKEQLKMDAEQIKAKLESDANAMGRGIARQILGREVAELPRNK